MKHPAPDKTISRAGFACVLLFAMAVATPALAQHAVAREQDIVGLRLGQRVLVDDGTCKPGEIKQVSGAKMTSAGVMATHKCVPRLGPKKK